MIKKEYQYNYENNPSLLIGRHIQKRDNAANVITGYVFVPTFTHEDLTIGKVVRVFCYVEGYPELGKQLPCRSDEYEAFYSNELRNCFFS